MKLDPELCRKILFAIEDSRDDEPASIKLPVDDYNQILLSHHTRLLQEGGLIHAVETGHAFDGTRTLTPHSLTWKGCEFVRAVRNEAIWNKARSYETLLQGELPMTLLYELAVREMRRMVGLDASAD